MKSGAPAFGTPEHVQMRHWHSPLARHVGLPWRGAAGAAANTADAQAAGETHMSLWGNLMANAGMVKHSAGWLEGGLTFGFENLFWMLKPCKPLQHSAPRPPQILPPWVGTP